MYLVLGWTTDLAKLYSNRSIAYYQLSEKLIGTLGESRATDALADGEKSIDLDPNFEKGYFRHVQMLHLISYIHWIPPICFVGLLIFLGLMPSEKSFSNLNKCRISLTKATTSPTPPPSHPGNCDILIFKWKSKPSIQVKSKLLFFLCHSDIY